MSTPPSKTHELLLEQLLLGELSPEDERLLRADLAPDEVERRLAALRAADRAFHERLSAEQMVADIKGRVRVAEARESMSRAGRRSWRYLLPSLAAVACLALWFARVPSSDGGGVLGVGGDAPDTTRIKGIAPHLVIYRREGDEVETLSDGAHAARGDMLQVGYVAAEARYGVIVSIDGGGTVTLHFPDTASASTQLEPKGEHLLGHAYELDAAPAFERFFFVSDQRPVDVTKVLDAARVLAKQSADARRGALALGPNVRQQSLTLVKE